MFMLLEEVRGPIIHTLVSSCLHLTKLILIYNFRDGSVINVFVSM